jgi:hypothetical protein
MKTFKPIALLLLFSLLFIGCEKQEYFKSESTIKKELQNYKWHRVQISINDSPVEVWEFHDGKITITGGTGASATLEGEYSVSTTLTKVFISTKNFPLQDADIYDGAKWTVVKLDGEVLIIAADSPAGGGLIQREFTKQ